MVGVSPLRRALIRSPFLAFAREEAASGIAMLLAALAAIVWANSPWQDAYHQLWETNLVVSVGDVLHLDHLDLRDWVNDALMAIFFFVVGLEIKREISLGELRDPRSVALPIILAFAGMLVPALIFTGFTREERAPAGGEFRWRRILLLPSVFFRSWGGESPSPPSCSF